MKQVVLAHMGGPSGAADLGLFLRNIFLDRELLRLPAQRFTGPLLAGLRFRHAKANYDSAGWTPVKKLTCSLADKLNARLHGEGFSVRALYTHITPYIEEAAADALVLPLYPQYSAALAGAMAKRLPGRKIAGAWYGRNDFTGLLAAALKKRAAGADPARTALMFIAHGLPESFAAGGDPYIGQVEETYMAVAEHFPGYRTSLSYIGKAGPAKWSGPAAGDVIASLTGVDRIVAAYLSFPLDNIEALYDIDIALKDAALEYGITDFSRAALPNDSAEFAAILEDVIRGNA